MASPSCSYSSVVLISLSVKLQLRPLPGQSWLSSPNDNRLRCTSSPLMSKSRMSVNIQTDISSTVNCDRISEAELHFSAESLLIGKVVRLDVRCPFVFLIVFLAQQLQITLAIWVTSGEILSVSDKTYTSSVGSAACAFVNYTSICGTRPKCLYTSS